MTTKKDVLIKLYSDFTIDVNAHIDLSSIFPMLGDIDIIDVIFLINHYFGSTDIYHDIIKDLLNMNNIKINDDIYHKIYPIAKTFLDKFKNI